MFFFQFTTLDYLKSAAPKITKKKKKNHDTGSHVPSRSRPHTARAWPPAVVTRETSRYRNDVYPSVARESKREKAFGGVQIRNVLKRRKKKKKKNCRPQWRRLRAHDAQHRSMCTLDTDGRRLRNPTDWSAGGNDGCSLRRRWQPVAYSGFPRRLGLGGPRVRVRRNRLVLLRKLVRASGKSHIPNASDFKTN